MNAQQSASPAAAARASPASRTYKTSYHEHSSLPPSPPRSIPVSRIPSSQEFHSALHSSSMISGSAPTSSSFSVSPYLSSVQCSPSVSSMHQHYFSMATPAPLELPDPVIPPSPLPPGYAIPGTKPERLMRRLSNKAKGTLRRKTSSSNQSRRDESSGPVARRRSDSKTITNNSYVVEQDPTLSLDFPNGLGIHYSMLNGEDLSAASDTASISDRRPDVVAPAIPEELVAGCILTKSTRNRKQDKIFFLDAEGSKISWLGRVVTKSIHIDNIKSIRTGDDAASQWHTVHGEHLDVSCCFIINYASSEKSNDVKTLHLIAHSREDLLLWVETLEALAKHREDMMTGMMGLSEHQSILRAHWDLEIAKQSIREGQPVSNGLDLAAITSLCRKLHIHCPKSAVVTAFHHADQHRTGLLTYEHFRSFVRCLRKREDILPVFNELKDPLFNGITRHGFLNFVQKTQGVNFASESVRNIWESKTDRLLSKSSCTCSGGPTERHLDFETFASFLSSRDCRIYAVAEKPKTLLEQPLNEYFISSSHNTYLLGRQVNGTSSVEAYVMALRRGCRSVEIDCWDGENDNPRVTHGFTKTTSVHFVDVINAINRCAFDASPYPVILSLEVHCNPVQQARMVEIMKEVLGDKLLLNLLQNHTSDLPSPEELKYKILVKVKATQPHPNLIPAAHESITTRKRSTSSPYSRPIPVSSQSGSQQSMPSVPIQTMMSPPESFYSPTDRSVTNTSASSEDESDSNITSPVASEPTVRRVKTSKIIPALAATAPYFQGYSYRSLHDLSFQQFNHIFSLNENMAHSLCTSPDYKGIFEEHNLRHMCRVYPKNTRINSSNFDPNTFWRRGVQMVALNYQTYDTYMQMNQAMFAAGSDQSGYVLKPGYLRKQRIASGVFQHRLKLPRYKIGFSVKIISAQQLPRLASMGKNDSIDPFIEVQMFSAEDKARGIASGHGGAGPSSVNEYHGIGVPFSRRTKVVRDNGYNPQFNDTFELALDTKYPELVFVRFIVYQAGKNSRQLAVFTSKLDSLQNGYRHVPLYNSHGEELIFSTLFCQITKREPQLPQSTFQDAAQRTPRPRSLRTMLSRNMSGERARDLDSAMGESRLRNQRLLNEQIERRRGDATVL